MHSLAEQLTLPSPWAVTFKRLQKLTHVVEQVLSTWVKINADDKSCRQAIKKQVTIISPKRRN